MSVRSFSQPALKRKLGDQISRLQEKRGAECFFSVVVFVVVVCCSRHVSNAQRKLRCWRNPASWLKWERMQSASGMKDWTRLPILCTFWKTIFVIQTVINKGWEDWISYTFCEYLNPFVCGVLDEAQPYPDALQAIPPHKFENPVLQQLPLTMLFLQSGM